MRDSAPTRSRPLSPITPQRAIPWCEPTEGEDLAAVLARVGLAGPRPVLVLVGGADGLEPGPAAALAAVLRECLVPFCERFGVLVIDGGTDAGVMALMGRARAAAAARFPLLGVAARGKVRWPEEAGPPERAALEPNHSHFLLVPGECWGDEVPWISAAAASLSAGCASLTLVAGGGRVTESDVAASLAAGRPTLVLAGSGGIADRIAAGLATGAAEAGTPPGLLRAVALGEAPTELAPLLRALLLVGGTGGSSPPPAASPG